MSVRKHLLQKNFKKEKLGTGRPLVNLFQHHCSEKSSFSEPWD